MRTEWYPDGRKKREGAYREGKKHGTWTFWPQTGEKQVSNYEDGRRLDP